jgi:hypothetical protein
MGRTEFVIEKAAHAGNREMVRATRYDGRNAVAKGWFELYRLQPDSPTGIDSIIKLLITEAK